MEMVDIYNNKRELTGAIKGRKELIDAEYRLSCHVWIINSEGKLLLQLRAKNEDMFPNMWGQTGGGVKTGKTSKQTAIIECREEMGIDIREDNLYYIGSYTRIKDIVDIWLVIQDIDITNLKLQSEEVEKVEYLTFDEFDKLIEEGKVVPTVKPSYMLMKNYYFKYRNKKMY